MNKLFPFEHVKIGPFRYNITDIHGEVTDGRFVHGEATYHKTLIKVDANSSKQGAMQTLMHEIIHTIRYQSAIQPTENEEYVCDALSFGLIQLIKDNPELIKEIVEL